MKKRMLSLLTALSLCLTLLPAPAMAVGQEDTGMCPHHREHTAECSYIPPTAGSPCQHEHGPECYAQETVCLHIHDESCYSDGVLPNQGEDKAADTCQHACSEETGCATAVLNCRHVHDEACGYAAANPGHPCEYNCRVCPVQALMDALPDPEDITADNAGEISAQLDAIDEAKAALTDEESDKLDFTRYQAVITALMELEGMAGENGAELLATAGSFTVTGGTSGTDYSYADGTLTILSGTFLTISGATTTDKIVIGENVNANITFSDLSIQQSAADACAFMIPGTSSATITLNGSNTLQSGENCAGLAVVTGGTVTIKGTGSLQSTGGKCAAGIGGGHTFNAGTIKIESGTITATGGADGAGIGGGHSNDSQSNSYGLFDAIQITGGVVNATAPGNAAAIGTGCWAKTCPGAITIENAQVSATTTGNHKRCAAIGRGISKDDSNYDCAVTIKNSIVSAQNVADKGNSISGASGTPDIQNSIVKVSAGSEHDNAYAVYGACTLTESWTIPADAPLYIDSGTSLTIGDGATLTNNGTIVNFGTLTVSGTLQNSGTIRVSESGSTINGSDKIQGNQPIIFQPVPYLACDTNGQNWTTQFCSEWTDVTSDTTTWNSGWYLVTGEVTISSRVTVSGTVHLILEDGCHLNATQGIAVCGKNSLSIYAQSTGSEMGKLTASGANASAGIGGNERVGAGTTTIYGGNITATGGGITGAGIGGGRYSYSTKISIHGGIVTASGSSYTAGIGGGYNSHAGIIIITGGTVTATGGSTGNGSTGIGDKYGLYYDEQSSSFSTGTNGNAVIFTNGIGVDSTSTDDWSGVIFQGNNGQVYGSNVTLGMDFTLPAGKTLTIPAGTTLTVPEGVVLENNGTITNNGTLVNNGFLVNNGTITGSVTGSGKIGIRASYIDETGSNKTQPCIPVSNQTTLNDGWYVVNSTETISNRITISGDVKLILADGTTLNSGGININSGNSLTIYAQSTGSSMGKLVATTNSEQEAGITCNGTLTINGGDITATGRQYGAGIGGKNAWQQSGRDPRGSCGTVIINGGIVKAFGTENAAGIGGGQCGNGGTVIINGGTVEATAGPKGPHAIGAGGGDSGASNGSLKIGTPGSGNYWYVKGGTNSSDAANVTGSPFAEAQDNIVTNVSGKKYVKIYRTQIPVPYIDANGVNQSCGAYTALTNQTTLSAGWYVVNSNVTINGRITVTGDVHLILADGCTLNATQGIAVNEGASLTIYRQSAHTGALIATASGQGAAIGANAGKKAGTITINGGNITASVTSGGGACIGEGGWNGQPGAVTINDGHLVLSSAAGNEGAFGSGTTRTITGGLIEYTSTTDNDTITGSTMNNCIVFNKSDTATMYGNPTINFNYTLASGKTITIGENQTLTNNAVIDNYGTININGGLTNNGTINNYGTINGLYNAGTEADPYQIYTYNDLCAFATKVNNGQTDAHAKLMADIVANNIVLNADGTLNGNGSGFKQWTPIGTQSKKFQGVFDGQGHTISGLYFNNTSENQDYIGLFGYVGDEYNQTAQVEIKNVGVIGSYFSGYTFVGGVCGECVGGTITNCYNTGSVSGIAYVGGVCGDITYGTITRCHNTGTVWNVATDSLSYCEYHAGVCGSSTAATITGCYNTGTVSGYRHVGGVCGKGTNEGNRGNAIVNCYNTGKISGTRYVGGVYGDCWDTTTTNCYNTGEISGTRDIGGVCGYCTKGTLTNCYNIGKVSGSGGAIGGVCGENLSNEPSTISNCFYLPGCATDGNNTVQYGIGNDTAGQTIADTEGVTTGKTAEQFASGEVAWLLQNGQTEQAWGQQLSGSSKDTAPVLTAETAKKVYQVSFQCKNGDENYTEYAAKYANPGGTVALPTPPTRPKYDFVKWSQAQSGSGPEFTASTAVNDDLTVYAVGQEQYGQTEGDKTITTTYGTAATKDLSQYMTYAAGTSAEGKFTYAITSGGTTGISISGDTLTVANTTAASTYTLTITATEKSPQISLFAVDYGTEPVTLTVKVIVNKAPSAITKAPTEKTGLVYTGEAQALVEAGVATGGTLQYSLSENSGYSADVPTGTNAGTYTVYYKVEGGGNYEDIAAKSVKVTIAQATPTVSVTAAQNLTYTGVAQELVTAGSTTGGTLQYSTDNSSWSTTIPTGTAAGTYTVHYKVVGGNNYNDVAAQSVEVTIAQATPTVTAPKPNTLTYTGTAQELVTAGGTTGGELQYSLEENGTYSTAIPTGTDAAPYTVYYKVVGDDNYNGTEPGSVTVTIAKATPTVTAPAAVQNLTYTGAAQALVTEGSTTGGELQYSLSEDKDFSTTIPTGTDAGEYTVYYKVVGNSNYNDIAPASVKAAIASFRVTGGTAGVDYKYENHTLTILTNTALTISTDGNEVTADKIAVDSGVQANMILKNVNINVSGSNSTAALDLSVAGVSSITLSGNNILKSGNDRPGVYLPANNQVTIQGDGELKVWGGTWWPGIGRDGNWNLLIKSGTIEANGGSCGAGIGHSFGNRSGGTLKIEGGFVTAIGGNSAAGIGGSGTGCAVTITGGVVTAIGGSGAAGIGNYNSSSEDMGTFSTGENGNAVIHASSIRDHSSKENWSGIIFEGNRGQVYGDNVTLTTGLTIPEGTTLTIPSGTTLTINNDVTLTVQGDVNALGTTHNYGTIIKKDQTAPSAPAISAQTADSVTLTTRSGGIGGVQYKCGEGEWQSEATFTGLTAATAYTFYARYAGNDYYNPSDASSSAKFYTAAAQPGANEGYAINYKAETITITTGYEVSITSDFASKLTNGTAITPGTTYYVRKAQTTGDDNLTIPASAAQSFTAASRPDAPSVSGTDETIDGKHDGQITGVTTAMEYKLSTAGSWTACADTTVTGLAPGTYYVRLKATDTAFYGEQTSVTINKGTERTYTLTVTAPTFAAVTYGYEQPAAQAITIQSSGNWNATISDVSVDGSDFTVSGSGSSVTAGGSINTWTIQPKDGLGAGPHTATITVTYNNDAVATAEVSFTVNKAESTVTDAPKAEVLTYTGEAQALVTAGTPNGGTMQYSLSEEGSYTADIPTGTDADTYTVYYKVVGDDNHNDTAAQSVTVTIAKATLTPTVASVENKVYDGDTSTTGMISLTGAVKDEKPTATGTFAFETASVGTGKTVNVTGITLSENWGDNYVLSTDKLATTASITTKVITGSVKITGTATMNETLTATYTKGDTNETVRYQWYRGDEAITDAMGSTYTLVAADVGMTLTVKVSGTENYSGEVTSTATDPVAKATPTITTLPTAEAITYGQSLHDSQLAGGEASVEGTFSWTDGSIQPAVSDSETTEYRVTFTPSVAGYETVTGEITLKVNKAPSSVTAAPSAKDLTYTGAAQALVTEGTASGGTMQYSLKQDSDYSAAIPTGTNAGEYTVYYKVVGDGNHSDTTPMSVEVTIGKANLKPVATANDKVYDGGTFATGTISFVGAVNSEFPVATGTFAFKDAGVGTDKPVQVTDITLSETWGENYILSTDNLTTTATITAKNIKGAEVTLRDNLTYTGEVLTQTVSGVTVDGLTVTYKVSGNRQTNAGTYPLTITGYGNFTGNLTVEFTIAKASNSITSLTCADIIHRETPQPSATALFGSDTITYSYSKDENGTFEAWNSENHVGTWYVKASVAGTENYTEAVKIISFKETPKREETPNASIDYVGETLTGLVPNADYAITSGEDTAENVKADENGGIALREAWLGTTLSIIRKAESSDFSDSMAQTLEIPARRAAPDASIELTKAANSITITNPNLACEYSVDGVTWNNGIFTGLTAGADCTVRIRLKATSAAFHSAENSQTVTTVNDDGSTTLKPGETVETEDGTTITNHGNTVTTETGGTTTTITPPGGGSVDVGVDGTVTVPGGSTIQTGDDGPQITTGGDGSTVGGDGTITVPGGGSVTIPENGGGDTTITVPEGGGTITPTEDGKVEVPGGSTVTPDDGPQITTGDEGGTVGDDGTVTVPSGSSVTVPDGEGGKTTITVPDGGGTIKPTGDDAVEVPGGSTVEPEGGPKMTLPEGSTVNPDGTITVPGGGEVTIETEDGETITITIPEGGGTIKPTEDGKVEVPGGTTFKTGDAPEITLPDGGTVDQTGAVTTESGGSVEVGSVTINPPNGETVTVDQDGTATVPPGSTVTEGGTTVTLPDGGTVEPDGSIIVPPDGKVTTTTEDGEVVTITPPSGGNVDVGDDGTITVPGGSTIQTGEDGPQITTGDDGSTVGGDGTVTVPGGSSVTIPDGEGGEATITVPEGGGTITPTEDGKVEVPGGSTVTPDDGPQITTGDEGGTVGGDGSITIPGGSSVTVPDGEGGETTITVPEGGEGTITPTEDGKVEVPGGSTVTPDDGPQITTGDEGGTVGGDGSVTVPGGSSVTIPDGEGGEITITIPEGGEGTVTPTEGGNVEVPDGSTVQTGDGPEITLPDGGTIDQTGTVTTKPGGSVEVGGVTITPPSGETVTVDQDGTATVPPGSTVTEGGTTVTLPDGGTVDPDGSIIVPPGGKVTIPTGDGETVTITVPEDGGKVQIDEDGNITVPGGSTITPVEGEPIVIPETGGSITPGGDVTYSVTVTFDSQGGSVVESQTITVGSKATKPIDDPTRSGYTFDGWYTDADGRTAWDFDTAVTGSMTLYAKWTVKYIGGGDIGGGSSSGKPTVTIGGDGEGGKVETGSDGTVTITPEDGYEIIEITVNGEVVEIPEDGKLTGLKRTDKVVVIFGKLPTHIPVSQRFVDVPAGAWFEEAVQFAVDNGLFYGTSDTTFSPNEDMTRGMLATVLYRLEKEPETSTDDLFTDVADGKYYTEAIAWATEKGIVTGYGNGLFGPDDSITREQLAAMLYRYAGRPAVPNLILPFSDADRASAYAMDALRWAVDAGILNGKGNGILDPTGKATRAEVAAMLMRYCDTLE